MIPLRLYLPYASYPLLVHVLDPSRLARMHTQINHILWNLCGTGGRSQGKNEWMGHPAVEMWRGYETSLLRLLDCCIKESVLRGWIAPQRLPTTVEDAAHWDLPVEVVMGEVRHPEWLGCVSLHASHRACLKHHDGEWYQQFDWDEPPIFRYWTPQRSAEPADWLIKGDQTVIVTERLENGDSVCMDCITGDELTITNREVVRREWTLGRTMSVHELEQLAGEAE